MRNRRAKSLLLSSVFVSSLLAQHADMSAARTPGQFRVDRTERSFTTEEILREFEEAGSTTEYLLGTGDEITVDVWERAEVSGKHLIGPDGAITLPVAGHVKLQGLTRTGAVTAIKDALQPYYTVDLGVVVRIDRYAANRILVLGRVASPGVLMFESPPTLLEAITRAGALPVGGIGAEKATLTRAAVFRGRDRVIWVDLGRILNDGDLAMNIRLQRDDVIYIPDANDQVIYVLGEVERPGAFGLTPNMTFVDAVSLAGGSTEDANNKRIRLIRPSAALETVVSLRELIAPDRELNFTLQDGDIVYVPRRGLARVGYVMQKLSPFTGLLLFTAALTNR